MSQRGLLSRKMDARSTEDSLVKKYLRIVLVVVLYWFVSISLVFINKALLGGSTKEDAARSVDAPMFVTWFQCVVTVGICVVLSLGSKLVPRLGKLPDLEFNYRVMMQVLPLSVIFVCMITFNNLCLKYVALPFYYIGRSLTTVFNVVMTWLILGERTSLRALICCAVIVFGFWLGVDQEGVAGSLSILGTFFGVLASLFVSLNSIYTKKVLPAVNNSVWLLGYYNNINACLLFLPLMLINREYSSLLSFTGYADMWFWTMMVLGGVFGFAIGYVTGLQIQVTSPLSHNISGTAKACAQTVIASYWFQDTKSFLWWISNWVVLFASAAYTRVRQLEMEMRHHSKD